MTRGFFVTGTDTEIGKTTVSVALLRGLAAHGHRSVGMKPVGSGARATPEGRVLEDAQRLAAAGTVVVAPADLNPYAYEVPVSPHLARRPHEPAPDLRHIDEAFARLARSADFVVVEGAGGWLTPVTDTLTMADLAVHLGLPVVLVVGIKLGAINHARLTHAAIVARPVPYAGWVANRLVPDLMAREGVEATLARDLGEPLGTLSSTADILDPGLFLTACR